MVLEIITALEHFSMVSDFFNSSSKSQENKINLTKEDIKEVLNQSTDFLQKVIHNQAQKVIDKIEQDKMEELISRIKNLNLVLNMSRSDQALTYLLTVQESVDYAYNRFNEGKKAWFLPYLIGKTTCIKVFTHLGNQDQDQINYLQEEFKKEIYLLLTDIVTLLVFNRIQLPWLQIEAILNNKEDAIKDLLYFLKQNQSEELKATNVQKQQNLIFFGESTTSNQTKLDQIDAILSEYHDKGKNPDIFTGKLIPTHKAKNAMTELNIKDELILLYDNTLFGSSDEGVFITENHIYWTAKSKHYKLQFNEIKSLTFMIMNQAFLINQIYVEISISSTTAKPQLMKIISKLSNIPVIFHLD